MAFTADFGGDTSDYLRLTEGADVDLQTLRAAQVGEALRQFTEMIPPPGLPTDLELNDVEWEQLGAHMDQVIASTFMGR